MGCASSREKSLGDDFLGKLKSIDLEGYAKKLIGGDSGKTAAQYIGVGRTELGDPQSGGRRRRAPS